MQTTVTKKKKTTIAVGWEGIITDDDGKAIARMTGALDVNRPLGSVNLLILNRARYEANADAVKEAYENFQSEVQETIESTGDLNSTVMETLE